MSRLGMKSCLLLAASLAACSDRNTPTALSADAAAAPNASLLVELSRPNAVGTCNTGYNAFGTWPTDNAEEPSIAVNPVHPNNIVAAWIQGFFQDVIAAASSDGGQTWQQVPLPLTTCSGGPFLGAGDPWLSFAPNGDLYGSALAWTKNSTSSRVLEVMKSTDSGLHWTTSVVPGSNSLNPPADHPSLTADPTNAAFVYATWLGNDSPHSRSAVFARTTDGGSTWEPARAIFQSGEQSYIQFSQVLVLPNGTLVDLYQFYEQQPNGPVTQTSLQLLRSTDHGASWSAPINAVTMTPLYEPDGATFVVDPETGQSVWDNTDQSAAVDGHNGNLYAVWEDGRFSNFQYNDIALSMSTDGGFSWSAPIRVNQTPLNIAPANRQAFHPSIAVAANGTIGVSYYDFRFNDPNPGLPTDRWLVQCHPVATSPAADPACWNSEVRLTASSFNIEAVVTVFAGKFTLGDYFGLATAKNDFVGTFVQPDQNNVTSVFFTRKTGM
jgi:hypothetical protein